MDTPETIVGREEELAAIERLLDGAAARPAGLLLEGVAGIGKTTVWEAALAAAARRERRLLVARGAGAEVRLAYAGLADLLAEVDEGTLAALPRPQRAALQLALLRGGEGGDEHPDPRAIATGFLSALELLAAEGPLVLALDDLQWLDPSSAAALRFAVRRLAGPVGVLVTARREEGSAAPELELRERRQLQRLPVAPLAAAELRRIVVAESERSLPPPSLGRVIAAAAGNPFIALELARTLEQDGPAPLSKLPASLREIVDARLAVLPAGAREAVIYAALLTRPDVPRVQRALGDADAAALLGAAEVAGILRLDGAQIVFAHPLLATGAYSALDARQRRAAHRAIAAVTAGEERARHLALACTSAEPTVIAALDAAATEARRRGSAAAAAELLELALRLGAEDPPRRQLAAEHHLDAGEVDRARELLEGLVAELPAGNERAAALAHLATIRRLADDFSAAIPLLEQAIAECREEHAAIELALALVFSRVNAGDLREAMPLAAATLRRAERLGEDDLLAQALAIDAMVRFLRGGGADEEQLRRALRLERPDPGGSVMMRPSLIAGLAWLWSGRLAAAREAIERAQRRCREQGAETDLALATMQSGRLACLSGDLAFGRELVADGLSRAEQVGSPTARAFALENQVQIAGWVGDVELARRAGAEAVATFETAGAPVGLMFAKGALGQLELSLGDHAAAAVWLLPAARTAIEIGCGEPGAVDWIADAVEVLAALDRLEESEPIRAWQRRRSDALGRPELLAVAARLDALALTAGGQLKEAEALLSAALAWHRQAPSPYAEGRTLLVRGQVQRRLRRRAAACASFGLAAELFASLGAALWSERARSELERIAGQGEGGADLTPAEARVVARAAAGMTNRAAAAELFVSPKTIEATLTRAYRKLGIHSRAELGRWMAERERAAEIENSARAPRA